MDLNNILWNRENYSKFINYLLSLKDEKYYEFHRGLVPGDINIIGIRSPKLKEIAKMIVQGDYKGFLSVVNDNYYEEKTIEGLVIGMIKDVNETFIYLDKFIYKIDNWATCDSAVASLKKMNKNRGVFYNFITTNITSDNPWVVRFCFVSLLDYFVEEEFLDSIFNLCDKYNNDFYYIKMAVAWLISVCYIKYPDKTLSYIKKRQLDKWTHNKAIQKIIESRRVGDTEKEKLRAMKR